MADHLSIVRHRPIRADEPSNRSRIKGSWRWRQRWLARRTWSPRKRDATPNVRRPDKRLVPCLQGGELTSGQSARQERAAVVFRWPAEAGLCIAKQNSRRPALLRWRSGRRATPVGAGPPEGREGRGPALGDRAWQSTRAISHQRAPTPRPRISFASCSCMAILRSRLHDCQTIWAMLDRAYEAP